MRFHVDVTELTDGYRINVDAGESRYAEVIAPDVETGLRMSVPYMTAIACPDPFEDLWRRLIDAEGQDGPPQVNPDA